MSGGVDSSVAAALMVDAGHEVVGATLKLWGGDSDSGCCSVADVDDAGIFASAGAACASGALEASHVLLAMGLSEAEARTAVRFSLGHTTTAADVEAALAVVPKAVEQLRR